MGLSLDGFLSLLKPPGMTSHDVVDFVRVLLPRIKVGHGGTLDPSAAGVLPLLLGKATRLSSFLLHSHKVYRAELYLGTTTDTGDSKGNVLAESSAPLPGTGIIEKVLQSFTGEIEQVPPMYSAVKHKGKKLYQYAHQGEEVKRSPRKVTIDYMQMVERIDSRRVLFEVKCSGGTYIRSLCAQIGETLGCGGHMSFLLRKRAGKFDLAETATLEELKYGAPESFLFPLDYLFQDMEHLKLGDNNIKALCQGRTIPWGLALRDEKINLLFKGDGKVIPVYNMENEFVLLAKWEKDKEDRFFLKPDKVFK